MPPANLRRRRALADAAVELLAEEGVHGLTHRAVEARGDVPSGTATNYFRDREALLTAAAERVVELHLAEMATAMSRSGGSSREAGPVPPHRPEAFAGELVDLIADSLWTAATTLRDRYLAVFELQLEARRRPALAAVLARLGETALVSTTGLHGEAGSPLSRASVATLITLYSGALFSLVARPAGTFDRAEVRTLVEAMVRGVMASGRPGAAR